MTKVIEKPIEVTSDDPVFNLWALLIQTRDLIRKARSKELRMYGITVRDSAVLFIIGYLGKMATPAEISRWLVREHHAIVTHLDRMEKKGFITATKGKMGKNIISLNLTSKGRKALAKSENRESLRNIISEITLDEINKLSLILGKLRKGAIKELGEKNRFYSLIPTA